MAWFTATSSSGPARGAASDETQRATESRQLPIRSNGAQ
ncbi:hypothetical protein AWB79_06023 [Caballeronia hypogeia]|uniref:Uncharacterized protein n=1 Tax=Caballeronia hypogeia TaxID=1777140 RepID=A0A158CV06_9BURK|nr:hypothetical protein AWB79_06023 [Caballeronia hypogeia]